MERAQRLRKGNEFDSVYSKGAVVGGPLLVLRHIPNNVGDVRWGFAVGKRLAKQATLRNRTKRRLKAAAERTHVLPGVDIVVTARHGAIEASYADLEDALVRALRKARLLVHANGSESPGRRRRPARSDTLVAKTEGRASSSEIVSMANIIVPGENNGSTGPAGELGRLRPRPQKGSGR